MILFRLRRPRFNLFDSKRNLTLLVIFLLIFPKGGIKFYDIPFTWGYLLLGIFSIVALTRKPVIVHRERLQALIAQAPFLCICAFTMLINGIQSIPMAISFWISFLFLPVLFFLLFSKDVETFDSELFFHLFRKGIFFIAIYGIALFVFKQLTGQFLEIPFLSVNIADMGHLEEKCINRGNVYKLISTYNNGNIYGICILMLLPLYSFLETSQWKHWIVKFSLIMTLSRTVWIGLIFHEICYQWFSLKNKRFSMPKALFSFLLVFTLLAFTSSYYGFYWSFFADPTWGGRKEQLEAIANIGIFSTKPFDYISEIVYAGIVQSFGWAGFAAFIVAIAGPFCYQIFSKKLLPLQRCIAIGLATYLFISASDGAILLLPVMAIYWFLLSLLFRKSIAHTIYQK